MSDPILEHKLTAEEMESAEKFFHGGRLFLIAKPDPNAQRTMVSWFTDPDDVVGLLANEDGAILHELVAGEDARAFIDRLRIPIVRFK